MEEIIKQFAIKGKIVSCDLFGNGHIGVTSLLVVEDNGKTLKYIIQKINNYVFKDVEKLMSNISLVTEYMRKEILKNGGNPDIESLTIIPTVTGKSYYYDEKADKYYRVYLYVANSMALQSVEDAKTFEMVAEAFGKFAKLLSNFDATKIYDVIPNFHNTKVRYENFKKSLLADKYGRAKDVQQEIKFIEERKSYCTRITELLESGKMPIRVTHNDTKLNNVLFDKDTKKPLAVVDLDTIMQGSICYDFGDAIRYGCNTEAEDCTQIEKVKFNVQLFEAFTRGYLSAFGDAITQIEKDNLAFSSILITYECGMRFLTDYLDGDVYFAVKRKGQNLDRARTQLKLVSEMEKSFDIMQKIVAKY